MIDCSGIVYTSLLFVYLSSRSLISYMYTYYVKLRLRRSSTKCAKWGYGRPYGIYTAQGPIVPISTIHYNGYEQGFDGQGENDFQLYFLAVMC